MNVVTKDFPFERARFSRRLDVTHVKDECDWKSSRRRFVFCGCHGSFFIATGIRQDAQIKNHMICNSVLTAILRICVCRACPSATILMCHRFLVGLSAFGYRVSEGTLFSLVSNGCGEHVRRGGRHHLVEHRQVTTIREKGPRFVVRSGWLQASMSSRGRLQKLTTRHEYVSPPSRF